MTFDDPREIAHRIVAAAAGRAILLLSDFDGTLCEFEPIPETVRLKPTRGAALEAVAASARASIGLVSGRRLADLRERAGLVTDAWLAGLHGLEIEGFGFSFCHPRADEARGLIGLLARSLRTQVADLPGVLIEDKGYSMSMHVRQAHPDHKIQADAIFLRMTLPHIDDGALRLMPGSNVSELLPNIPWTKGDAVHWICETERDRRGSDQPPPCVVYLGDDFTDEDAFRVVGTATSIIVGPRTSLVEMRLKDPSAVEAFLGHLAAAL